METLENHVLDSWRRPSGRLATLHDPTRGEPIAEAGTGGIDMRAVAEHARNEGGPRLREMTFAQRGAMLATLSKALHAAREALIDVAVENGGNTRKDAKFDVDGAIGTLAAYSQYGTQAGDVRILADGPGTALGRSPRFWGEHALLPRRGVAVHVNAFNFPAWGLAEKAAVAWLAGMPVVTKPATATAMLAERVARVLVSTGALPKGAFQLLCGSAGDLLDHMGPQDVLAFTGSSDTGFLLRSKERLLRQSVRVNVEADSLNAAVLAPDVSVGTETWNLFLKDVVTDITQKAGQKCTAIRRVLVPRESADAVEAELAERLRAVRVGDPALDEVGMGPVSTADQHRDVRAGIERLSGEARVVVGGTDEPPLVGAAPGKGWFVAPTLLRAEDGERAKAVHEHEVFGPAATILPYDGSVEQAASLVRRGEGCLVSSVYSDDRDFVGRMVVEAGPWNGRLFLGSQNVAGQAPGPGTVLPGSVHGGPGRAGGGEELGAFRGLTLYQQRVALQGDRAVVERLVHPPAPAPAPARPA
jgi:3,4-dehydroadipyl-CoA semialdehyde dehydrogenase